LGFAVEQAFAVAWVVELVVLVVEQEFVVERVVELEFVVLEPAVESGLVALGLVVSQVDLAFEMDLFQNLQQGEILEFFHETNQPN
jgi:hypothetical protein